MGGDRRARIGVMALLVTAVACGSRSQLGVVGARPPRDEEAPVPPPLDASTDGSADIDADLDEVMDVGVEPEIRPVRDAQARHDATTEGSAHRTGPLQVVFFGDPGSYDATSLFSFLEGLPADVTRLPANPSPVTVTALSPFDVVILDHLSRTFDASEAAAMQSWVHAGGALMSLDGFDNDSQDAALPNSLLAGFPLQFDSSLIALTASPVSVTSFSGAAVTAGLTNVPFWGGHHVNVTGRCDGATEAVAFEEGGPVGAICQHGAGRVYVWGDEWVEYSQEWTSATDAALFWQDAITWLAGPSGLALHPG